LRAERRAGLSPAETTDLLLANTGAAAKHAATTRRASAEPDYDNRNVAGAIAEVRTSFVMQSDRRPIVCVGVREPSRVYVSALR
jgi:hypothetical protein